MDISETIRIANKYSAQKHQPTDTVKSVDNNAQSTSVIDQVKLSTESKKKAVQGNSQNMDNATGMATTTTNENIKITNQYTTKTASTKEATKAMETATTTEMAKAATNKDVHIANKYAPKHILTDTAKVTETDTTTGAAKTPINKNVSIADKYAAKPILTDTNATNTDNAKNTSEVSRAKNNLQDFADQYDVFAKYFTGLNGGFSRLG